MEQNRHNPFTQEELNSIFKVSSKHPDRLNSRESGWLEFKEKFNFGSLSKYAKTMAAFANTQGGYIVYGIKNKPHKMIGVNEEDFNNIDPEKITRGLNESFSPEIAWEVNLHEFQNKTFGLLYTYESENKPVVAKRNSGEVKEAEIYYRYRGRSEKVKYPELVGILDEKRKQEQTRWMNHLERISQVGVENAAIFDINTGEVKGTSGSFIIDESLLPKISFIKEGQFHEKEGSPTLKLIGNIRTASKDSILPTKKIYATKTKGIRADDIISGFLNQQTVDSPIEYIKQICWESSSNLPMYHYIVQTNKTINEIIFIIEEVRCRSQSQSRLLDRLSASRDYVIQIPSSTSRAAKRKTFYRQAIIEQTANLNVEFQELRYLIQSIRSLTKEEFNKKYVLRILKEIYEQHYTNRIYDLAFDIRFSICYVDFVLNKEKVKT